MTHQQSSRPHGWLRSRSGIALVVFLAVAAFFLVTEHRTHTLSALPFVLVLLCPLLHLFLHGRHGDRHAGHGSRPGRRPE